MILIESGMKKRRRKKLQENACWQRRNRKERIRGAASVLFGTGEKNRNFFVFAKRKGAVFRRLL